MQLDFATEILDETHSHMFSYARTHAGEPTPKTCSWGLHFRHLRQNNPSGYLFHRYRLVVPYYNTYGVPISLCQLSYCTVKEDHCPVVLASCQGLEVFVDDRGF